MDVGGRATSGAVAEQNWTALAARRAMAMDGHCQRSTNIYAREFAIVAEFSG